MMNVMYVVVKVEYRDVGARIFQMVSVIVLELLLAVLVSAMVLALMNVALVMGGVLYGGIITIVVGMMLIVMVIVRVRMLAPHVDVFFLMVIVHYVQNRITMLRVAIIPMNVMAARTIF